MAQSEKVIVLVRNNSEQLRFSLWDGGQMRGDPPILLGSNTASVNYVNFDVAEANVPRNGGTGTAGGGGN